MNNFGKPPFDLIKVSGDWTDNVYDCYSNRQHWNGWAMPYFTKEEALRIVEDMKDVSYDEPTNSFVWTNADDKNDKDVYEAITIVVDGEPITVYPIGSGFWCWDFILPSGDLKVYNAFWSGEVFPKEQTRQLAETFFPNAHCYNQDDINKIFALEIGQTWESDYYKKSHTVKRIQ